MTNIRYTIDVPQEAIPELDELMQKHSAYFHPRRQITAINDIFMERSTAMGHHVPGLIMGMNRFLEQENLDPRVPEALEPWDLPRLQSFLMFAVNQFQWQDNEVLQAWWQEDGRTWDETASEYPEVFQEVFQKGE